MDKIEIIDSDGDRIKVTQEPEAMRYVALLLAFNDSRRTTVALETTATIRRFADDLKAMANDIDAKESTK